MLTDSQGLAEFYASTGEEGKLLMAAGPLLTGGEVPWKTLDSDASILRLDFTLPKTLIVEVVTANELDDVPQDAHLSWRSGPGGMFDFQTGGQFLPLVTKKIRIGGLVPGKKVSWKLTALNRVDSGVAISGTPARPTVAIPYGNKLSTVFLRVVNDRGQPFPPQMIGVIATPIASKLRDTSSKGAWSVIYPLDDHFQPQPGRERYVIHEDGCVEFQLDFTTAYRLNFFVRRGVAGDFGKVHKSVREEEISAMKPGSIKGLGDIVLTFPAIEVEGAVLDALGEPVPGASVELSSIYFPYQAPGKKRAEKKFIKSTAVVTDAYGKFLIYLGYRRGRGYTLKASKGILSSEQVLVDESSSPMLLFIH